MATNTNNTNIGIIAVKAPGKREDEMLHQVVNTNITTTNDITEDMLIVLLLTILLFKII